MTSHHRRRMAEEMQDSEFRAEYEEARREVAQVDELMRTLDRLRDEAGLSKAELARRIGKHDSTVRRLFSAEVNPELRTIVAMAEALDAEIQILPRRKKTAPRRVIEAA